MEMLSTIKQLRDIRDQIRKRIKKLDLKRFKDQTFGPENEYTYKGMVAGVEALLIDISALTQYQAKFLRLSTYDGRSRILNFLREILNNLEQPNNLYPSVDNLKQELLKYNIRNFSEHQIVFEKEISTIIKLKLELETTLKEISENQLEIEKNNKESLDNYTTITTYLENFKIKIEELKEKSNELKSLNTTLSNIQIEASQILNTINNYKSDAESSKTLIESFSKRIQDREDKLEELEKNTELNNKQLREYQVERQEIIEEAELLIDNAKKALEYTTTQSLSSSFHSQYKNAKKEGKLRWWVGGAAISLAITLGLGLFILSTIQDEWFMVLGRILLLPIPIAAATFCARQYNKQKNIIEDYAYKTTIAKAIVGFSEQLKKNGKEEDDSEYVEYIQKALKEIHQDPLRPRKAEKVKVPNTQMEGVFDLAKKMVEFSKNN